MSTRKSISEIKDKFKTGDIPTGQDYSDFIDATFNYIDEALLVQKVNGIAPDENGNVQTSFQIVNFIPPDEPMSIYPHGTSEFYGEFDPADYSDFIAQNPSFEQLGIGQICVRTFYDVENNFAYQEVDNIKNGAFEAGFARVGTDGTWGELVKVGFDGNITPIEIVDEYEVYDATKVTSANKVSELNDFAQHSYTLLSNHMVSIADDSSIGHVKPDGITISVDEDGVISTIDNGNSIELANNVSTNSPGKALDAYQGFYLYNELLNLSGNLYSHNLKKASDNVIGHVKPDNTSIVVDTSGTISTTSLALIREDFDINKLPLSYNAGITLSTCSSTNPSWDALRLIVGSITDYYVNSNQTTFNVVTERRGLSNTITQTVTALQTSTVQTRVLTMNRDSIGNSFTDWRFEFPFHVSKGAISSSISTPTGTLYVDTNDATIYKKTSSSWVPIAPEVVDNTFTPTQNDKHVFSAYTINGMFEQFDENLPNKVRLNRIWESDQIPANATSWVIDFSDEVGVTNLSSYEFEIYDDGVLIFGNPLSFTTDNDSMTVTIVPVTPINRPFTITCIGRGMEFE